MLDKNKTCARLDLIFFLIAFMRINYGHANENVLGCGGFVKFEDVKIDLSQVEIRLFNKQGSLKDKAECSPSNGYYFIPIYAKGDYVLRISSPLGWSFEPMEMELNFNGKTDICSHGVINFKFKGFGITGKVSLAGSEKEGARNVTVELKSIDGNYERSVHSNENGDFTFTPVSPGKYIVRAKHPEWYFSKSEFSVVVESGNTVLPVNSLVVSGFNVFGNIETNGQLTDEIGIALYTKKNTFPLKCASELTPEISLKYPDVNEIYETFAKCYAKVEKTGAFTFRRLPPGQYLIEPIIENTKLKLNISPKYIEFPVKNETVAISKIFQIKGFSVYGKILSSVDGPAVAGANIKINGIEAGNTNADGIYMLSNYKAGTYTIQAEAPNYLFDGQKIKIQLNVPLLPDIIATSYKVCGKVFAKKSYVIGITEHGSTFHATISTRSETGEWCIYLQKGKYSVEVLTTDLDKQAGIKFFPMEQHIKIEKAPILDIIFSQIRATLVGELQCLPDAPITCSEAEVSLQPSGQVTPQTQKAKAQNSKYVFENLPPGPYELNIPPFNLCFESARIHVNINSSKETAAPFIHYGYEVSIVSSHCDIMKYWLTEDKNILKKNKTIKIFPGVNTFCVPEAGLYEFVLEGCHKYDDSLLKNFNTNDHNPGIVSAFSHKNGVRVLSNEKIQNDSLQLSITGDSFGTLLINPVAEEDKTDGFYVFRHDIYLKYLEKRIITPISNIMIFIPDTAQIIGRNDCIDFALDFKATKGTLIYGRVSPAIEDVHITLSFPQIPELSTQEAFTTKQGDFKFGPINQSLAYDLKAEKESYVFSEYDRHTNTFHANKLCGIVVIARDDQGRKLEGVLLSLSGSESYRKNLLTRESGVINFHSLSPSQYFLRPMMKEYKFNPSSKIIDIKDGETIEIKIIGKRVAYSLFGTITSLNREPFGQVNVEAISDGKCLHHQEESTSENNGQYRIRGLQPGCSYSIRPKGGSPSLERSIPQYRAISVNQADLYNINLIAISPISFVDVSARVTASTNEYYKSLQVQMFRKGSADSPIYSQRVESPLNTKRTYNPGIMIYFPRIPLDGKTFFVELKTSILEKNFIFTLPVIQFTANASSIFMELDFKPEVRTVENDLNQNSISALILIALLAVTFFKQDLATDFVYFIWSHICGAINEISFKKNNKKESRKNEPTNYREIEQMAEQINAIRKKTKILK